MSDEERRNRDASRSAPAAGRLWWGLLLPVFAWGFQLFVSYAFVEWYCHNRHTLGRSTALVLLQGISLLTLLLALAGAALSWRSWRQLRHRSGAGPLGRSQFMAVSGFVLGVSLSVVILVQSWPYLVVPLCI